MRASSAAAVARSAKPRQACCSAAAAASIGRGAGAARKRGDFFVLGREGLGRAQRAVTARSAAAGGAQRRAAPP
eukprot:2776179-Prymnesium_polylepis.1